MRLVIVSINFVLIFFNGLTFKDLSLDEVLVLLMIEFGVVVSNCLLLVKIIHVWEELTLLAFSHILQSLHLVKVSLESQLSHGAVDFRCTASLVHCVVIHCEWTLWFHKFRQGGVILVTDLFPVQGVFDDFSSIFISKSDSINGSSSWMGTSLRAFLNIVSLLACNLWCFMDDTDTSSHIQCPAHQHIVFIDLLLVHIQFR